MIALGAYKLGQRDTELNLGVVDPEDKLVRNLRLNLWQEHLELDSPESLMDSRLGVEQWYDNATAGKGRLRLFQSKRPRIEFPYRFLFNKLVDPYNGPERES